MLKSLPLLLIGLAVGLPAAAQTRLERSVTGSGAVISGGSGGAVAGTLGQSQIGIGSNATQSGLFGFWYTWQASGTTEVPPSWSSAIDRSAAAVTIAPNPASARTTIRITIAAAGRAAVVLHDHLGRELRRLFDGDAQRGTIAIDLPLEELASGQYMIVLDAAGIRTATSLRIIH